MLLRDIARHWPRSSYIVLGCGAVLLIAGTVGAVVKLIAGAYKAAKKQKKADRLETREQAGEDKMFEGLAKFITALKGWPLEIQMIFISFPLIILGTGMVIPAVAL